MRTPFMVAGRKASAARHQSIRTRSIPTRSRMGRRFCDTLMLDQNRGSLARVLRRRALVNHEKSAEIAELRRVDELTVRNRDALNDAMARTLRHRISLRS
ncbi:hypothetical protein T281_02010 [Rhodomicrobium udaipurense JA643]|nr:hypothetical protein T281_02010 [Rhodomicrobium udaipurense JA643]